MARPETPRRPGALAALFLFIALSPLGLLAVARVLNSRPGPAEKGPGSGDWVSLSADFEARLGVGYAVIAEDQHWASWVEVRNNSSEGVLLRGDPRTVFIPRVRRVGSPSFLPPAGRLCRDPTLHVACGPGLETRFSESDDRDDRTGFTYRVSGREWRLSSGRYELGGSLELRVRRGEKGPETVLRAELPPARVEVWRPVSDAELREAAGQIRREWARDPARVWPALAALVKHGMRRAQVEVIFPSDPPFQGKSSIPWGGLRARRSTRVMGLGPLWRWPLDRDWEAVIAFDVGPDGPDGWRETPEDRVVGRARIERRPAPPPDPASPAVPAGPGGGR